MKFVASLLLVILAAAFNLEAQTIAVTERGDTVVLHPDGSYQKKEAQKEDPALRAKVEALGKKHSASIGEIEEAYSMALQGWRYALPQPKSRQAAWGNFDGRTTWWFGYWKNKATGEFSGTKPRLTAAKIWKGDGQNNAGYYRRGGSPPYPTGIEMIMAGI